MIETLPTRKLDELFKQFTDYALLELCLEPTTIVWYNGTIRCFYKYLRRWVIPADLDALNIDLLRDFLIHQRLQGNSPRTIHNIMKGIRAFCAFLVKRGHLPHNPFDKLEKPKLPLYPDAEEWGKYSGYTVARWTF